MKKIVFVLLTILFGVLEITITWHFQIGWHNYQLMLIAVIVLSMFDYKLGYGAGVLCGFLMDCVQSQKIGLSVLFCLIAVTIVRLLSKFMYKRSFITAVVLTAVITFLFEFVQYWMFFILKGDANVSFALTKLIFPQVFINAACAFLIYAVYCFLWKKMGFERERWER